MEVIFRVRKGWGGVSTTTTPHTVHCMSTAGSACISVPQSAALLSYCLNLVLLSFALAVLCGDASIRCDSPPNTLSPLVGVRTSCRILISTHNTWHARGNSVTMLLTLPCDWWFSSLLGRTSIEFSVITELIKLILNNSLRMLCSALKLNYYHHYNSTS